MSGRLIRFCAVEECNARVHSRGWCSTHYARWKRNGTPTLQAKPALEETFWRGVGMGSRMLHMESPCWEWTRGRSGGYGVVNSRQGVWAYRFSYQLHNGAIPDGYHMDHRCRNRGCVRPDHLRLATVKQNQENRGADRDSATGIRGVRWSANRWQAQVIHNGIRHYIGRFTSLEEAEAAVIAKRNEFYTHNELDRA